jgi:predicted nuclease of restriction endonuclease-like (RecB) superfamily
MNMTDRKSSGKQKQGVIIPIAPLATEMGESYKELFASIKGKISHTRLQIVHTANTGMILLYWEIGDEILKKQLREGWGAKVIDRLSKDLFEAFPDMKGFSPRNLGYMKKFAQFWRDLAILQHPVAKLQSADKEDIKQEFSIVQQVVAQIPSILQQPVAKLPWRSIITLLDKVETQEDRELYAKAAFQFGWSSNILSMQIEGGYLKRQGKTVNNFANALPPIESDMAVQIFKDPYLFDFIGTDIPRRELEVEKKLTEHIEKFLLELGQGFAFVGRQVHLEIGNSDFYIDLLFYHLKLRCYVVVELKAGEFSPGFVSQLSMYQNVVNDLLRHPDDKPTIGLLLVKNRNKTVVEYSLAGYSNPIGVAEWQEQLNKELPNEFKSSLPTIKEIEDQLNSTNE